MNDKSALLQELRIDRHKAPDPKHRNRSGFLIGGIAMLVAVVAGAGWFLDFYANGVPVHVAMAKSVTVNGSAAGKGASLLDGSGYVVARRSATVAAKITAKLVENLVEEGQRVKEGEIIARLDDSNNL